MRTGKLFTVDGKVGKRLVVRCLGPGKEHTFKTDSRFRRVCPSCSRKMQRDQVYCLASEVR